MVAATATAAGTPLQILPTLLDGEEYLPTQLGTEDVSISDLLRLEYEFPGPVNVAHAIWLLVEAGNFSEFLSPIENALLAFAAGNKKYIQCLTDAFERDYLTLLAIDEDYYQTLEQ